MKRKDVFGNLMEGEERNSGWNKGVGRSAVSSCFPVTSCVFVLLWQPESTQ